VSPDRGKPSGLGANDGMSGGQVSLARGTMGWFVCGCLFVARGFASYRLCQRETSLEVRQLFMAGPDDEQVEAPTFSRGDPLRITEGGRYA
jgi:hypothetical protein